MTMIMLMIMILLLLIIIIIIIIIRRRRRRRRRRIQEQIGKKLTTHWDVHPHRKEHFRWTNWKTVRISKDLELEIEQMWGAKAEIAQAVIGALGLIKKGLEKYIQQIQGNINWKLIHEQQKITIWGTSYILRKTLFIK